MEHEPDSIPSVLFEAHRLIDSLRADRDPRVPAPEREIREGECPCCGAPPSAAYEVELSSVHVALLRWIASHPGARIQKDCPCIILRSQSHAELKRWGLARDADPEGKRRSGRWWCTELGADWLAGSISVPAKVTLWRRRIMSFSREQLHVSEVP